MPYINARRVSNLSKKDQITKLMTEIRCRLAPSPIHGIGVFMLRDIKKGERLYIAPGSLDRIFYNIPFGSLTKLFPEQRAIILDRWPSIINGSAFLHPNDEVWLASWINHSDNPNYEQSSDTALRDLKAGEEVTESYRIMDNAEKIYPFLKK